MRSRPLDAHFDELVLTFDVDWAPDFILDDMRELLTANGVRATWFVTHASPAIDRLRRNPELFELAIHPNFSPTGSHGATPEEVIRHCMRLVPEAFSVRTHGLVQSTHLLWLIQREQAILADCSLYLPGQSHIQPFAQNGPGGPLLRLPYIWEDDFEFCAPDPTWTLDRLGVDRPGLKILDLHPIHVHLNSSGLEPYAEVKKLSPYLGSVTREQLAPLVRRTGRGARSMFHEAVAELALRGGGRRIKDIATDAIDGGRTRRTA